MHNIENLIGQRVFHKIYKSGEIVNVIYKDDDSIYNDNVILEIQFKSKLSKFSYPSCIDYIKFDNDDQHKIALQLYKDKKESIKNYLDNERLQREEEKRKLEEEKKLNAKIVNKQRYIENKKEFYIDKHATELFPTFLVYQGKSFKEECDGQYLYVSNSYDDRIMPFWDTIEELQIGDVILHSIGQYIKAISRVISLAYDWNHPTAGKGIRVDCEYVVFNKPLDLKKYREVIIKYNQEKHSPFNKNGQGNQGYLYPLDFTLAKYFIEEISKDNNLDKDYVNQIIKV